MKSKKLILFLSALMLMTTCSACSWFGFGDSSSDSETPSYSSTSPDDSSIPDEPDDPIVDPDQPVIPGTVGTLECGVSLFHGNQTFTKDVDGMVGWYSMLACENAGAPKQYAYFPYVKGHDILSFAIHGASAEHPVRFKLGYNYAIYSYNAEENAWFDEEGTKGNITMMDEKGNEVDFGSLRYKGKWPWTTFTISGVESAVELIFDLENCTATADSVWKTFHATVKDIRWNVSEDFENPNKPEIPPQAPVSVDPQNDGAWNVSAAYENEENGWFFAATKSAKAYVTYIDGMDTLTFKMKGDMDTQGFTGVFKLNIKGVDYIYKNVNNVWGWYDGETLNTDIAMYDANGDAMDISSLTTKPESGWPWVTFVISNVSGAVEIVTLNENANEAPGWGKIVTLYAKDFVWSDSEYDPENPPVNPDDPDNPDDPNNPEPVEPKEGTFTNGSYPIFNAEEGNGYCFLGNANNQTATIGGWEEGYNVLTFKMKGDAASGSFAGSYKLKVNDVVYVYDYTTDQRWEDAEGNACTMITMYDAEGNVVDLANLRAYPVGGWTWVYFKVTGVTGDVEILADINGAFDVDGWGYVVTLYAHEFVWSDNADWAPEAPAACEHEWAEATCLAAKTCSKCGETEGGLGEHAYGELIAKVEATAEADGMEAHYFCDVCDTYFDTEKNETTLEDLTIEYVDETPEVVEPKEGTFTNGSYAIFNPEEGNGYCFLGNSMNQTATIGGWEEGYNVLTFKMKGDASSGSFAGSFKLKINGTVYVYDYTTDQRWEDAEGNACTMITMYDTSANVIDLANLRARPEGGWTWVSFKVTGVTGNVEILADTDGAFDVDGWGYVVTLYANEFVWSDNADWTPEACEHTYSEATCKLPKICSKCKAVEGGLGEHAYGELIAKVEATAEADGMEAHYFCDVCDTYFDTEKNETTLEDLTIEYVDETPEVVEPKEGTFTNGSYAIFNPEEGNGYCFLGNSMNQTATIGGWEEGYNVLTFKMKGDASSGSFAGSFKLKINGTVYVYDYTTDQRWEDADGNACTMITMYDTEGNVIDLANLRACPADGWKWVSFKVTGVTGNVEILADTDGAFDVDGWGYVVTLYANEFVWSDNADWTPEVELTAEEQALKLLASSDSYADVPRGDFESVVLNEDGSVTVKAGIGKGGWGPNDGDFSGFGLTKAAVQEWIELGFNYLTFTVELSADEGKTAPAAIVLYDDNSVDYVISGDVPNPKYCANGSVITLDLEKMYNELPEEKPWLFFIFLSEYGWVSTESEGYLTFSNIIFSATNS